MFVDEAEIIVIGGHGGPGKVGYFRNRKGPSGGNGGKGGNVYAEVSSNTPSLKRYVEKIVFRGADGESGGLNNREGLHGNDLILYVPAGTSLIDLDSHTEIVLDQSNTRVLLCMGGAGGLGNMAFKSSTNQTPRLAEPGKTGQERRFKLIQKLIANFGLIGLPNAGKSSLLNVLTAANVKTANYPFTTLEPNLGVYDGKIIADIPGLIEGASAGRGLGIKFLRHIEKVKLLLHCISVESPDPLNVYKTVVGELKKYNEHMLDKEEVILLTKIDLVSETETNKKMKMLKKTGKKIIPLSILKDETVDSLKVLLTRARPLPYITPTQ